MHESSGEPADRIEESAEPSLPTRLLLLFEVRGVGLAVDAHLVEEVFDLDEIVPLPDPPDHVRGLVFRRDRAIPVLDLDGFLGLTRRCEGAENTSRSRIVILESGGMHVAIPSQRILGLRATAADELAPPGDVDEKLRRFAEAQMTPSDDRPLALLAVEDLLAAAKPQGKMAQSRHGIDTGSRGEGEPCSID